MNSPPRRKPPCPLVAPFMPMLLGPPAAVKPEERPSDPPVPKIGSNLNYTMDKGGVTNYC